MSAKKKAPKPADVKAPGPEKKSTEQIDQAALLEIVQAQATTIAKQEAAMEDFVDLVNDLKTRVVAQEDAGQVVERESDVFVDPYEGHESLDFKVSINENGSYKVHNTIPPDSNFELGRKLKWIYPPLRDDIGMRGWVPVQYGDSFLQGEVKDFETGKVSIEAGAKLEDYLGAAPSRMAGSEHRDDYVRRGDTVLAWLDMKIWIARMRKREDQATRKRAQLQNNQDEYNVKGRLGAHVIGPGLTRGGDPHQHQSGKSRFMPDNIDPEAGNLSKSTNYIPVNPTSSIKE